MMCWYQAQHTISVTNTVTGSFTEVGVMWDIFSSTVVYTFILFIFFLSHSKHVILLSLFCWNANSFFIHCQD